MQSSGEAAFVPDIPSVGGPHGGTSWKTFFFQIWHLEPFEGHKIKDQTFEIVKRSVHWLTMERDVGDCVESCWGCLQFRKMGCKSLTQKIVPVGRLPWQHGVIYLKGPMTLADIDGYAYIFTYTCCLHRGSLLEPTNSLENSEVRRVMGKCIFRSLTVPQLFGHDRGPALTNTVNDEMDARLGIVQRSGAAWRPWEQSPTE